MHRFPWQTSPPQSAVLQQLPGLHPPLQQSCANPHSALVRHGLQELLVQTLPGHSSLAQQPPTCGASTHAPAQHFFPAPHCESEAQVPQYLFELQTLPGLQSAVTQQFPLVQLPPQHLAPKPQSVSWVQLTHLLPLQVCAPGQS